MVFYDLVIISKHIFVLEKFKGKNCHLFLYDSSGIFDVFLSQSALLCIFTV